MQTCTLLDAAYGDGQLGVEEYESRTATAMQAPTLGDLWALTQDLQIPAHLLESSAATEAPTVSSPRRLPALAAAVVAVAIGAVVGYLLFGPPGRSTSASESTAAQPVAAGEAGAIVVDPVSPLTADGFREFLRLFELKFGDTIADDVGLFVDDATVTKMVPGQPLRYQRWMFTGGFEPWTPPSIRDRDQETVDLTQLDIDGVTGLIARAPEMVHLPSGRARAVIRSSGVSVHVEDSDGRTGDVRATLDGEVVEVRTAEEG